MAEPHQQGKLPVETRDRGIFDCFGKKQEKPAEDLDMTDQETAKVSKPNKMKEEDKHTLKEELHRSHSNSSSSSYEEGEGGEKKRKKKGLKEKIKEKMSSEKEEGVSENKGVSVPLKKCDQEGSAEPHQQEKKGFLEKIKEKLPGQQHKKPEEVTPAHPTECAADGYSPVGEAKDKKGILDKIKEKLPGHHKNDEDELKAKEN